MCVAYPGRVERISGRMAKVNFNGNLVDVNIGVVEAQPGDYVLVHAGMAIEAMDECAGLALLELFAELE